MWKRRSFEVDNSIWIVWVFFIFPSQQTQRRRNISAAHEQPLWWKCQGSDEDGECDSVAFCLFALSLSLEISLSLSFFFWRNLSQTKLMHGQIYFVDRPVTSCWIWGLLRNWRFVSRTEEKEGKVFKRFFFFDTVKIFRFLGCQETCWRRCCWRSSGSGSSGGCRRR